MRVEARIAAGARSRTIHVLEVPWSTGGAIESKQVCAVFARWTICATDTATATANQVRVLARVAKNTRRCGRCGRCGRAARASSAVAVSVFFQKLAAHLPVDTNTSGQIWNMSLHV